MLKDNGTVKLSSNKKFTFQLSKDLNKIHPIIKIG